MPAKAKCFFKLHPRVERWRNTELGAIRRFKDKASDGLTLVQKYKDKSDDTKIVLVFFDENATMLATLAPKEKY